MYTYPQNLSGFAGTWLYLELVKHLNRLDLGGDIAELGVFQGGNAFCSLLAGGEFLGRRTLRLFDSFAGFPDLSVHDPSQRRSEFVDTTLTKVRSYLSPFSNVRIHPGFFEDTLAAARAERFAFVYYDADLYEPAMNCSSSSTTSSPLVDYAVLRLLCRGARVAAGREGPFLGREEGGGRVLLEARRHAGALPRDDSRAGDQGVVPDRPRSADAREVVDEGLEDSKAKPLDVTSTASSSSTSRVPRPRWTSFG